ncbi:EthD family reductase [Occultella gossypii]|uniref:EthD family reductase n=1 Tax=Occultella gossypii TaxID=2800820 RepID=A0ABS7S9P4_9MICO|nr:EthD family reductase [Occultella gossypii]MBZ2197061.1 EthD family reductase [Occultella gossypii]
MSTKITLIIDNPIDPTAFESAYPDLIVGARNVPGLLKLETSKVWPKEDGTATPAYRMIDLYFRDYEAANAPLGTPEMAAFFSRAIELATGGMKGLFSDVEDS